MVYIGVVGGTLGFDAIAPGESILVYDTKNDKLSERSNSGEAVIAWD